LAWLSLSKSACFVIDLSAKPGQWNAWCFASDLQAWAILLKGRRPFEPGRAEDRFLPMPLIIESNISNLYVLP
jgi:hypothetical protein